MRFLIVGAFVLDGAAAVGFVGMMALGEGRMTPLDASSYPRSFWASSAHSDRSC